MRRNGSCPDASFVYMDNFLHLVILSLSTWRISSLVAQEHGPFDVFGRLRDKLGVVYDLEGTPAGTNEVSRAIICVWCNSLWIGLAWYVMYYLDPVATITVAMPFALSALAVLIESQA